MVKSIRRTRNSYSDKYRRCIIEQVDKPPTEWLQREKTRIDQRIAGQQRYRKFLDTQ